MGAGRFLRFKYLFSLYLLQLQASQLAFSALRTGHYFLLPPFFGLGLVFLLP
jgi:hypothetical protein